ncbi:MAG TPA: DUF3488 and transglutaminase-like domain-containing protein [Steroidobacter sp.]
MIMLRAASILRPEASSASVRTRSSPLLAQRLLWVIAGLALSVLPHARHLAPWVLIFATAAAALRVTMEIRGWPLPPRWLRIVVAFAALAGVLLTHNMTLNGIEAGTALLVVMAGMKLLETTTVRDLTVIVFLSYFAVFAAFLYDQSLVQLPYMLVAAWLLTATLMRLHQTSIMPIGEAAGTSAKMFLQALPLAILLFLFFPRLPGQFWAVPARSTASTGLSEEMSPGDVSELSLSSQIAFRVEFEGSLPPPSQRYWRGPVLHDFDGRTWRRGNVSFAPQAVEASGPTYRYTMTLEPHQRRWVFPLDAVTSWPPRQTYRTSELQLMTPPHRPITTLKAFTLESSPRYTVPGELPPGMRYVDTLLPRGRNPRAVALARELRAQVGSDAAFVDAVLRMFREQEYFYTLEPPRLEANAVDDFLFNTRRGFCEHFASAFTMMARAAGIPARVVTGYQGGEYNPLGGYLIVRQSDAHAWSEVWLGKERGWVRVDPTAAVAPERIERGLDAAMSEGEPVPGRLLRQSTLLSQIRLAWDAANAFWNNQIVQFGEIQQRWLMSRLNLDLGWQQLGLVLIAAFGGFFIVLSVWLAWRFRPRRRDPVAQVYGQLCKKLARIGLGRLGHEGPSDYLGRVLEQRPDLATPLSEIRGLYLSLRYGPSPLGSELSRLKFLVNQLKV